MAHYCKLVLKTTKSSVLTCFACISFLNPKANKTSKTQHNKTRNQITNNTWIYYMSCIWYDKNIQKTKEYIRIKTAGFSKGLFCLLRKSVCCCFVFSFWSIPKFNVVVCMGVAISKNEKFPTFVRNFLYRRKAWIHAFSWF